MKIESLLKIDLFNLLNLFCRERESTVFGDSQATQPEEKLEEEENEEGAQEYSKYSTSQQASRHCNAR